MPAQDPRIVRDHKLDTVRAAYTHTAAVDHDFGVFDNKGRAVGTTIRYYTYSFVTRDEGDSAASNFGHGVPAGEYIAFSPCPTRAGQDFGAVQASRMYIADHEGRDYMAAAIAKYLKAAKRRAVKQWGQPAAATTPEAAPAAVPAAPKPAAVRRTFAVRVNDKAGNSWIASYAHNNRVTFSKGAAAERFAAAHRACSEVLGAVVVDAATCMPPALPCDVQCYRGAHIAYRHNDGSVRRAQVDWAHLDTVGYLSFYGTDSKGALFGIVAANCPDIEATAGGFLSTVEV